MGDEIKSSDFALQAQKKILGKMSSKKLTKLFVDEKTGELLDEVYTISKLHTGNKKESQKLLKNIIKVVIKIGVLQMNDQFSCEEMKLVEKLNLKMKMVAMTVISFYEVDFTFDKFVLSKQFNEARTILQLLVSSHLTDKSKGRVNSVFDFLGDADFLENLFSPKSKYRPSLTKVAVQLNKLLEEGTI